MTAEYKTAQRLQQALEREYALQSKGGYLEDEEEEEQPKTPEIEDRYKVKALYPVEEYEEREVYRVRLMWHFEVSRSTVAKLADRSWA